MATTSDDLMEIARTGAEKVDLSGQRPRYPNFGDVEDQRASEYDDLLEALHDDELFQPVDVAHQEALVEDLIDNHARHVWLHQEAAFHLGMALGLRIAEGRRH